MKQVGVSLGAKDSGELWMMSEKSTEENDVITAGRRLREILAVAVQKLYATANGKALGV